MTPDLDRRIRAIINDPAVSYWLKQALEGALRRDPVDAANDAEVLAGLLMERADQFLSANPHPPAPKDPSQN